MRELIKYYVGVSSPIDGVYIGWEEIKGQTKEKVIRSIHKSLTSYTAIDEPYRAEIIALSAVITWFEVPVEVYNEISGYWKLKDELVWGRGE